MPNDWFQFRKFLVKQNRCAMKVGTDSVLLGSWLPLSGHEKKIADLGTGTGLLALIMAQRSNALVVGFELDQHAADQAGENFAASPWAERLTCIYADIKAATLSDFDVCILNPPYFNQQLLSPSPLRNRARHIDEQGPQVWMAACRRLLHDSGKIGLIIPVQEENNWLFAAKACGFFLERKVMVSSKAHKPPGRLLCWMGLEDQPLFTEELIIESQVRGHYTAEFQALVAEIYPEGHGVVEVI